MQSAAMFLAQQMMAPQVQSTPSETASTAILNHWWESLCASRTAQGLSVDVNGNALMYRSYWYGLEAANTLPGMRLAVALCDPDSTLPDDWPGVFEQEFAQVQGDATAYRDKIVACKESVPKDVKVAPQLENSWADRMEEEE